MINVEFKGTLVDFSKLEFKTPLEKIAKEMQLSIQKNFKSGGRPQQWDVIKRTGVQSTLWESGKMFSMIESGSDVESAWAGIASGREFELKYLYAHQYGYDLRRLPERPYILWQEEDVEMVKRELSGYIGEFLNSKGEKTTITN